MLVSLDGLISCAVKVHTKDKVNVMKYPTVIVNVVSVRFDDEGRYNFNDLHAAAVTNGQATES